MFPAKVFAPPAPNELWLGPAQRGALSGLLDRAPLKLLAGPPSSGKTVLLAHAGFRLKEQAVVLRCPGPKANDPRAVLSTLLAEADLDSWTLPEADQRNLLAVFIQQRRAEGQRVIIVVDQADRLAPAACDELDRLRRFRLDGAPAVELLLATTRVRGASAMRLLRANGGVAIVTLEHASQADVVSYIGWRFSRHGLTNPFRPVAMRLIGRLSGGYYGAVDTLCRMSMLLMRQRGREQADARLVHDAVRTLIARRKARGSTSRWEPSSSPASSAEAEVDASGSKEPIAPRADGAIAARG